MNRQAVILVAVALGTAASFAILQGMFDRADHRKAIALVRGFRGPRGTLEDQLAGLDPGARGDGAWSSEILSGCRGFVRVRCRLPGDGRRFDFDVDLVRRSIHPGNELGQKALAELGGPDRPAATTPPAP